MHALETTSRHLRHPKSQRHEQIRVEHIHVSNSPNPSQVAMAAHSRRTRTNSFLSPTTSSQTSSRPPPNLVAFTQAFTQREPELRDAPATLQCIGKDERDNDAIALQCLVRIRKHEPYHVLLHAMNLPGDRIRRLSSREYSKHACYTCLYTCLDCQEDG
jgi:hypothetical protein